MKRFFKKHWPILVIVAIEVALVLVINIYLVGLISQLDALLGIGGTIIAWAIAVRDSSLMEVSLIARRTPKGYRTAPGGLGIAPTYEVVIQSVGTKNPVYLKSYQFSSEGGLVTVGGASGTPLAKEGFAIQIPMAGMPKGQDFIEISVADNEGNTEKRQYCLPYTQSNQTWDQPVRIS